MHQSVFEREHQVLNQALENDNPSAEDFAKLTREYKRLVRQSEKIVTIGDSTQNKLVRAQKMLHRAIQRYKSTADQKSEILSIVSHEIKNKAAPIRELTGWAINELKEGPESLDHPLELLGHVHEASNALIKSVNDTLNRESSRSSSIVPVFEWSDLSNIAEATVTNQQSLAQKKGILVRSNIQPDCEAYVDEFLIGEVFENLVSNAIKFSQPEKEVSVSLKSKNGCVVFCVTDQGQGLSKEDKELLFGKFQTLSAKPTGDEKSTGLGLYIANKLVNMHNGSIEAFSKGPGEGSTFTVTLPVPNNKPGQLF